MNATAALAAPIAAPTLRGGWPLLHHLPQLQRDSLGLLQRAVNELGDLVHLRAANRDFFVVRDPELIKDALQDNARAYSKQTRGYDALRLVLGNGLLTSEGDFWLRQRRLAQPAFHRQRIAGFAATMARLTEERRQAWSRLPEGTVLDVADELMELTLRVVGQTLLSTEVSDAAPTVKSALYELLHQIIGRTTGLVSLPPSLPTPANLRLRRARASLDAVVTRIIQERRRSPGPSDLLGMFMEAADGETGERMTDEQLRDEVMTIFLAGHETTANALTWTFYLLSQHPHVDRQLAQEAQATLHGRTAGQEDLQRLELTARVIQESMRLYPPVWMLVRRAEGDQVLGGYRIPGGSFLGIAPYVCHRNPRFFPDPERFDPDRFLPERLARLPRFAYFPFSGGPRICIGNSFAMTEAQIILASLVQAFRLELEPGHPVALDPTVTLRPKYGMRMRLVPRR